MKPIGLICLAVLVVVVIVGSLWARKTFSAGMSHTTNDGGPSLYDLKTKSLAGETVDLAIYKGQVSLVVNTASKCGLTPQYEGLEALYRELADRGFIILAFPSNDFMGQEPGSADEIALFCQDTYDVTFPLMAKCHVKGDNLDPVYKLLTAELEDPTWNFTKYLVNRQGQVVARFGPRTKPDDPQMKQAIVDALEAK